MLLNPDETVVVTRTVARPVLPRFTTLGTVCWYIKREQVSNQQMRIRVKLLWP